MAQLGSRQGRLARVYASGLQQQAAVTAPGGDGGGSGQARGGQAGGPPPLPLLPSSDPSRSSSGDGCSGSGDGPATTITSAAAYYPDVPTTDSDGDVGSHFGPWLIRGCAVPESTPSVGESLLDDDAAPMLGEGGSYEGEEEEEEHPGIWPAGMDPHLVGVALRLGGGGGSSAGLEDEFSFGDYSGVAAMGSPKPFLRGSRGSLGKLREGEEGNGLQMVDHDDDAGAYEEGGEEGERGRQEEEEEEEDTSADALRRVPSDVVRRAEHYAGECGASAACLRFVPWLHAIYGSIDVQPAFARLILDKPSIFVHAPGQVMRVLRAPALQPPPACVPALSWQFRRRYAHSHSAMRGQRAVRAAVPGPRYHPREAGPCPQEAGPKAVRVADLDLRRFPA